MYTLFESPKVYAYQVIKNVIKHRRNNAKGEVLLTSYYVCQIKYAIIKFTESSLYLTSSILMLCNFNISSLIVEATIDQLCEVKRQLFVIDSKR